MVAFEVFSVNFVKCVIAICTSVARVHFLNSNANYHQQLRLYDYHKSISIEHNN